MSSSLRHAPVQARGARRLDALLDAAEAIIVEGGFESLTLTAVAERSGSSIGSLYRFFSKKEQLLEAIALRLGDASDSSPAVIPPAPIDRLSLDDFVRWITSWIASVVAVHPALPVLVQYFGAYCAPLEARITAPLDAFLRAQAPALSSEARALAVRMALKVIDGGLKLGAEVPGTSERAALAEIRVALSAYLRCKIETTV